MAEVRSVSRNTGVEVQDSLGFTVLALLAVNSFAGIRLRRPSDGLPPPGQSQDVNERSFGDEPLIHANCTLIKIGPKLTVFGMKFHFHRSNLT